MPTYEYKCLKCKKRFEKLQSMSEAPVKKCPKCSGKVERLMGGGGGFIFKGSGFYATDYKRKPVKSEASTKTEKPTSSDNPKPPGNNH